jgi:hypothetical protein
MKLNVALAHDLSRESRARNTPSSHAGLPNQESATWLLERSIAFGHGRLAVIRLSIAVKSGAVVPASWWEYCLSVAAASRDRELEALMQRARLEVTRRCS